MRVGMVGCGKLGLMVALAIESRGHEVAGYDISMAPSKYLFERKIPFQEEFSSALLNSTRMRMLPLNKLCSWADIIFLAPQTPHLPEFEGTTLLTDTRADFDYTFLRECVSEVAAALPLPKTCVVISTVLPGTIDREVRPLLQGFGNFRLVYEPLFIAMGTVVHDFLNPEFVLVGVDDLISAVVLEQFYKTIHSAPVFRTDVRTAEGIKVFYNTFITAKIVLANLYGEIAHKIGMNVDDITRALSLATDRLISPRYLQAGMGDGGGCHPRDNIALSWLARKLGISYDIFSALMNARERHCVWFADLIQEYQRRRPVFILGRAFKPETNIETGSPSLLLSEILTKRGVYHSAVDDYDVTKLPAVYFIGTQHERFREYRFMAGSTVIDPFRYLEPQPGVELVRIGYGRRQDPCVMSCFQEQVSSLTI